MNKFNSEADVQETRQHIARRLAALESAMCTLRQTGHAKIAIVTYGCDVTLETMDNIRNPRSGVCTRMMQTIWKVNGKRVAGDAVEQTIINHIVKA